MTNRPDALLFNAITPRASAVEQKIKNFLTKWPPVRQKLPFPEMAEMRITPEHPEYKKILDEAFLMLLDGKLRSHTEIVKFLEPYSPPEPPPPPPPPRRGRAKKEAAPGAPGDQAPKKRGRKPKNAVAGEAVPARQRLRLKLLQALHAAAPAKQLQPAASRKQHLRRGSERKLRRRRLLSESPQSRQPRSLRQRKLRRRKRPRQQRRRARRSKLSFQGLKPRSF